METARLIERRPHCSWQALQRVIEINLLRFIQQAAQHLARLYSKRRAALDLDERLTIFEAGQESWSWLANRL